MLTDACSMKNDEDSQAQWRSLGYFSIIIGDIAGFTGAGIGLGYLAWKKLGAPWWVIMPTSMAGLVLAFYRIYKLTQRDME
jgi:hypothetical protein